MNRAVGRPQVSQQQRNLIVRQREHCRRQVLLMRTLAVDPQLLEPGADTGWRPAIAVAADDQLVPRALALMTSHLATELFCGVSDRNAVLFGRGGVAQRLMLH